MRSDDEQRDPATATGVYAKIEAKDVQHISFHASDR